MVPDNPGRPPVTTDPPVTGGEEPGEQLPDPEKKAFYNLSYGGHERHVLDILLPKKLSAIKKKIPFFLLIHGGSWTGGDKSNFYYFAKILNDNGYAAVTMNYRLIGAGATYAQMLEDIGAALSYIKEQGGDYMLSTDKVAIQGNSAGGHLALLYSYKVGKDSPIKIAFAVSQVGPTDFTDPDYFDCGQEEREYKLNLLSSLIGEEVTEEDILSGEPPEAVRLASPITHVTKDFPPTLLAYGEKDPLVPYSNGVRLLNKLREANSSEFCSRMVLFKNSGHNLDGDKDALDESLSLLYNFAMFYLPLP